MGATTSMIYSGAVDATVGTVVSGAASSITSTYEMHEELDVTLYSLQQEIMKIQCAINAARRRRITDRELLVWLASLIDAFYLGNYYHRTFTNRNSHSQMIAIEGASNLAISPFYRVTKRRRTVKTLFFGDEDIRELYSTLKMLKSIDVGSLMLMVNDQPERPIRTYLYMDHNRLFARDKEREQVMNFLLGPSLASENNVDILPIIGSKVGGKTSLALHCCYDPTVQAHFSLELYSRITYFVYANGGNTYDFRATLKYLLKQYCDFTNITSDDVHTLTAMLKQSLSSERFLLILDNIWDLESSVWNFFRDCLRCGKQGSKVILIFDFDDDYKKIVNPGEVEPVIVDGFSEDEYTSFFEEHAFGSVDPEEYPELTEIGREIAKELGGSLWGAKIFGELLRDHLNVEFWSYFLRCARPYHGGRDFFAVLNVIYKMLWQKIRNNLQNCNRISMQRLPKLHTLDFTLNPKRYDDKLKSYRELMVLSPNHCTPTIENKTTCHLSFFVTEHVFLNKCTFIKASFSFYF